MNNLISLQKKRMGVYGEGVRSDLEDTIYDSFEDNVAYTRAKYKDMEIGVHLIGSKVKYEIREVTVISKPDVLFNCGDYITLLRNNSTWICWNIDEITIRKSLFKECNDKLRWQDEDNTIHEIPCVLTDKTSVYSDGIAQNKHITLADDQIMITIPNNEETNMISKNKRIIFNYDKEYIYEVTKIDKLIQRGLINIVMSHVEHNSTTDNLELGIANYIEPKDTKPSPEIPIDSELTDNYTVEITGAERILPNTTQTYTVIVKNNGTVVTDQTVTFSVDSDLVSILEQDGYSCVVKNTQMKPWEVGLKASLDIDNTIFNVAYIVLGY